MVFINAQFLSSHHDVAPRRAETLGLVPTSVGPGSRIVHNGTLRWAAVASNFRSTRDDQIL